MSQQQFAGRDERFLRRYDYGDAWIVAADLGVSEESVDVDVVGDTAIVVVEAGDRVAETEFELPGPDAEAFMKNGVLTLRGAK
ncbi:Hsp20/alpha crystallin family protein [Halegenticoccus tardaugens]|uniref:Hsp20/alpha crystallin family protein n=1 Tax=Halegenticoccus tardaugens TaxID=2071624 RepID=UPI00100A79A8|nr:Hsp20/alpha crystallin family protein [Halegenticoccus tardaugens]